MTPSSRAIIFSFVLMGKLRLEVEKLLQGIQITKCNLVLTPVWASFLQSGFDGGAITQVGVGPCWYPLFVQGSNGSPVAVPGMVSLTFAAALWGGCASRETGSLSAGSTGAQVFGLLSPVSTVSLYWPPLVCRNTRSQQFLERPCFWRATSYKSVHKLSVFILFKIMDREGIFYHLVVSD